MASRTSRAGKRTTVRPTRKAEPAPKRTDQARTAIYAGSFDPVTYGHLDVIRRASKIFDRLVVAIGVNQAKPPLFSIEERIQLIESLTSKWPNVEACSFRGLAVQFAQEQKAVALVRGLRTEMDFVYEMQMALMNRSLSADLETIFIPTAQDFGHISSTLVKEVASYGGDVTTLVPPTVARKIAEKLRKQ